MGPGHFLFTSYLSPFSLLSLPDALLTEGSLGCPSFPDGSSCKEKEWWRLDRWPMLGRSVSALWSSWQWEQANDDDGVNYEKHEPSGDQHLPLESGEVPFLLTLISCRPGYRHRSHSAGVRGDALSALCASPSFSSISYHHHTSIPTEIDCQDT